MKTIARDMPKGTPLQFRRWEYDKEGDVDIAEQMNVEVSNVDVDVNAEGHVCFMCYAYDEKERLHDLYFEEDFFKELIAMYNQARGL